MSIAQQHPTHTPPPPRDALLPDEAEAQQSEADHQAVLRPRRAARRDWLRAGFFAALGVGLFALLALVIWKFFDATLAVALPFVVGFALALLLDPLADKLERLGLKRTFAALIVFIGLLVIVGGIISVVIPALIQQANQLAENGPDFIHGIKHYVDDFLAAHQKNTGPLKLPKNFSELSSEISAKASGILQASTGNIRDFLVGSVTFVVQMVLALIITFFLLVDIDRLRARLFYLAPPSWRERMGQMGADVGEVFSDYMRGLLIVCSLYGLATIVLLYLLSFAHHQLAQYALLVGVVAGVLYAVPYLGSLTTALVTFLVAFAAATTPNHPGLIFGLWAVAATLGLNQIFDNIVTPRVVGGGVGLHPVLAIFALVMGGTLFQIWGMLLSVPIAASIQVILFRLYPNLTTPTPPAFLHAQGMPRVEIEKEIHASEDEPDDSKPDGAHSA